MTVKHISKLQQINSRRLDRLHSEINLLKTKAELVNNQINEEQQSIKNLITEYEFHKSNTYKNKLTNRIVTKADIRLFKFELEMIQEKIDSKVENHKRLMSEFHSITHEIEELKKIGKKYNVKREKFHHIQEAMLNLE